MELKCNNIYNLITQEDFECVGQVARNCDMEKLCISISEAQDWDLSPLFCEFWNDIIEIAKEIDDYLNQLNDLEEGEEEPTKPENYDLKVNLLCGGVYQGCKNQKRHLGIKRILVYYAYSRYVTINGYSDTANGLRSKTSDFAIPPALKELESFGKKYASMGYEAFKMTKDFLCQNKDVFTAFNSCDCKACGCADGCCDSQTKARGFKSKIISK